MATQSTASATTHRITTRWPKAAIALAALAGPVVFAAPASAHRSGCHAAHSCPSDSGSYVCGDTGNTNFCGVAAASPAAEASPAAAAPAAAASPAAQRATPRASTSKASTSKASTSKARTSKATTSKASPGATGTPDFARTGMKLTGAEFGGGALLLGVLMVVISRRLVESCYDPSILPHVRRLN